MQLLVGCLAPLQNISQYKFTKVLKPSLWAECPGKERAEIPGIKPGRIALSIRVALIRQPIERRGAIACVIQSVDELYKNIIAADGPGDWGKDKIICWIVDHALGPSRAVPLVHFRYCQIWLCTTCPIKNGSETRSHSNL